MLICVTCCFLIFDRDQDNNRALVATSRYCGKTNEMTLLVNVLHMFPHKISVSLIEKKNQRCLYKNEKLRAFQQEIANH